MKKEQVVRRFMGSETEYGLRVASPHVVIRENYPPSVLRVKQFLQNGSRMYVDIHGFAEYATPECDSLDELIAHELAGEQHVYQAYGGNSNILSIHKRAATLAGIKTTGAHENYSTPLDFWTGEEAIRLKRALALHLVTRTPIIGAGLVKPNGYHIGQKISSFFEYEGTDTTNKKTLLSLRAEHHKGEEGTQNRLHVVTGDANLSVWQIRMKFATTSLVLRLLEHGVDISDLFLQDPLKAAKTVAETADGMFKPLPLAQRQKGKISYMTALDIQEELALRAEALSQRVDLPERKEIHEWLEIVQALKKYGTSGDVSPIMKQLDWYEKLQVLEKGAQVRMGTDRRSYKDPLQRAYINDVRYDMIPGGIGARLRQTGTFGPHMPDAKAVVYALKNPPKTGRARLRGRIMREIGSNPDLEGMRKHSNPQWDHVSYHDRKIPYGSVDRDYTGDEVRERVARIAPQSKSIPLYINIKPHGTKAA